MRLPRKPLLWLGFGALLLGVGGAPYFAASALGKSKHAPVTLTPVRPGTLDASFGVGGKVKVESAGGSRFALAPNGEIFVASPGWNLVRISKTGRVDRAFGNRGQIGLLLQNTGPFQFAGMTVDSKGRLLIAGTTTPWDNRPMPLPDGRENPFGLVPESVTVYRFTPQGKPDRSFGNAGVFSSTLGLRPPVLEGFQFEAPVVHVTGLAVDQDDRPILTGRWIKEVHSCTSLSGSEPFTLSARS